MVPTVIYSEHKLKKLLPNFDAGWVRRMGTQRTMETSTRIIKVNRQTFVLWLKHKELLGITELSRNSKLLKTKACAVVSLLSITLHFIMSWLAFSLWKENTAIPSLLPASENYCHLLKIHQNKSHWHVNVFKRILNNLQSGENDTSYIFECIICTWQSIGEFCKNHNL